jgi:4-hydroxy-2-oxoheptanedioate aldolase
VETPEQVRALSGAVKYRPLKGARLRRLLAGEPCEPELAGYLREQSAGYPLIAMIESVPVSTTHIGDGQH